MSLGDRKCVKIHTSLERKLNICFSKHLKPGVMENQPSLKEFCQKKKNQHSLKHFPTAIPRQLVDLNFIQSHIANKITADFAIYPIGLILFHCLFRNQHTHSCSPLRKTKENLKKQYKRKASNCCP